MASDSAPEPGLIESVSIPAARHSNSRPLLATCHPPRRKRHPPLPLYLGEKSSLLSMYHICLYILTEFVPPPDFARKSRRSPIFAPKMVQNLPESPPLDASAGSLDDSEPKTDSPLPRRSPCWDLPDISKSRGAKEDRCSVSRIGVPETSAVVGHVLQENATFRGIPRAT